MKHMIVLNFQQTFLFVLISITSMEGGKDTFSLPVHRTIYVGRGAGEYERVFEQHQE